MQPLIAHHTLEVRSDATKCLLLMCCVGDVRFPHNLASLHWLFAFRSSYVMPPKFTDPRRAGVLVPRFYWDVLDHAYPLALWPSPFMFVQTSVMLFFYDECSHTSCRFQDTNDGVDLTVTSAPIASHGRCESLRWALSMTDPTYLQRIPCTYHMRL
jgi:hypothetical protein